MRRFVVLSTACYILCGAGVNAFVVGPPSSSSSCQRRNLVAGSRNSFWAPSVPAAPATKTITITSTTTRRSVYNNNNNKRNGDDLPQISPRSIIRRRGRRGRGLFWGVFLYLLSSLFFSSPGTASASDYGSMTDEQKAVAEAWRLVDNSYLDRTFNTQNWFELRQSYVKRKYKSMDEARTAIGEMVSTLGDKYTRYLPPGKYQSIVDSATGTLAGVGIEISTDGKGQVIASDVEDNSPAKSAGIRPDDRFVEVDGTKFDSSSTPDDVALKLRGPKGSKVGVVMERDGKTLDYILTREPITITSVKSYLSQLQGAGKVGVIRIKSFSGTTASTVSEKLAELKKKGASAFVIDLRGDPGGLLPGGVDTASLFLEENKPVVFVVNKNGVVDSQATLKQGIDLESPLAILVDHNTASAAEVFTAALKENDRATVIGENTFGKGIVQTIRSLSDDNGGVAITVSRYETPRHHDINKQGIPVDISTPVDCPKDDSTSCLANAGSSIFNKKSS